MIVHQIWMQGWKHAPLHVVKRVEENRHKWGKDSTVWFWDEARIVALLESKFPEHLTWFLSLQRTISKCDAARAFILHEFGGVYADCDFDPNPNTIQSFAAQASSRVVFIGSPWYGCNNFLIASPRKAKFWLQVFVPSMQTHLHKPLVKDILTSIMWSTWPVLSSSGPVCISRLLQTHPDLAFATHPKTEYAFGFHGHKDSTHVQSEWYEISSHRVQQLSVGVLLLFAFLGMITCAQWFAKKSSC